MGKSIKPFVDIKVSNLFVYEKDVKKIGLKYNEEADGLKLSTPSKC